MNMIDNAWHTHAATFQNKPKSSITVTESAVCLCRLGTPTHRGEDASPGLFGGLPATPILIYNQVLLNFSPRLDTIMEMDFLESWQHTSCDRRDSWHSHDLDRTSDPWPWRQQHTTQSSSSIRGVASPVWRMMSALIYDISNTWHGRRQQRCLVMP